MEVNKNFTLNPIVLESGDVILPTDLIRKLEKSSSPRNTNTKGETVEYKEGTGIYKMVNEFKLRDGKIENTVVSTLSC